MVREGRNMAESVRVMVPSKTTLASASSSSPLTPRNCCDHAMDYSAQFLLENHANFKNSAPPARVMFFNHNGSWLDFSTEVISSLKSAFLAAKPAIDLSIGGSRYLFDFLRMLQIDFDSGYQRSISWIDENGKCFFPKTFLGEDFECNLEKSEHPKIEINIRIDDNSIKRKREVLDKEEPQVSSSRKIEDDGALKRQRLSLADVRTARWPNTRLMGEGEEGYSLVRDYFLPGIRKVNPGATISAVHKCTREGQLVKARYEVFIKQMEITKAARGTSNTVFAWHGVSVKNVDSILMHGFGVLSKVPAPESHGLGVYLSPVGLPHISAELSVIDDNSEKHVILCRVILGNVEKVKAGSQQYYPSGVDFDTGADDPVNTKWYVVWSSNMNRHIIPEYVVSFKPFIHVPGQVRGSTCMKHPLEKLFSKMRSLVPPSKIQEVVNLYDRYKNGKLVKATFIRQLRLVAGDDLLRSTIQEIRGSE